MVGLLTILHAYTWGPFLLIAFFAWMPDGRPLESVARGVCLLTSLFYAFHFVCGVSLLFHVRWGLRLLQQTTIGAVALAGFNVLRALIEGIRIVDPAIFMLGIWAVAQYLLLRLPCVSRHFPPPLVSRESQP